MVANTRHRCFLFVIFPFYTQLITLNCMVYSIFIQKKHNYLACLGKNEECSNSESGAFPSLAEQETRLSSVEDTVQLLSIHQVVAQR